MKPHIYLFLVVITFSCSSLYSQTDLENAIINGNFEKNSGIPTGQAQMFKCDDWHALGGLTSDYYVAKHFNPFAFRGKFAADEPCNIVADAGNFTFEGGTNLDFIHPNGTGNRFIGFGGCEGQFTELVEVNYDCPYILNFWYMPRCFNQDEGIEINAYLMSEEPVSNALSDCLNPTIEYIKHFNIKIDVNEHPPGEWHFFQSELLILSEDIRFFAIKGVNDEGRFGNENYVYVDDINLSAVPFCELSCGEEYGGPIDLYGQKCILENNEATSCMDWNNPEPPELPINGGIMNKHPWAFNLSNAVKYRLEVYNRWGERVYMKQESTCCGFDNYPVVWNGFKDDGITPAVVGAGDGFAYQLGIWGCSEFEYSNSQVINEGHFAGADLYYKGDIQMLSNQAEYGDQGIVNYDWNCDIPLEQIIACENACPTEITTITPNTAFTCEGECTLLEAHTNINNSSITGYEWVHIESGETFTTVENTYQVCQAGSYQVAPILRDECAALSTVGIIHEFPTSLTIEKLINLPCGDVFTLSVDLPVEIANGLPSTDFTSRWRKNGQVIAQSNGFLTDMTVSEFGTYTFELDYANGTCTVESSAVVVQEVCCVDYTYNTIPYEVDCEGNVLQYGEVEFFPITDCNETIVVYDDNVVENLDGGGHDFTVPVISDGSITTTIEVEIPTITLEPNVSNPPASPINQTICSGETAVIDLTGADSYSWETDVSGLVTPSNSSGSSSDGTTQIQQVFEVPYHFALPNGGSVTYHITAYYGDLCHQQTVGVTVLPHPNLELSSSVTSICPDEPFSIEIDGTANDGTQVTYTWTANLPNGVTATLPVNGQSINHSTIINQQLNNTSNTDQIVTYTVTATFANGCSYSSTIDIEVIRHHGDKICDAEEGLIVNEVYLGGADNVPYIELLVKGNSNCEPVDIRNYIVDDNNGMGNQGFANGFDNANVSTGHIRFKDIPRWAAVPSGSLIVIHDVVSLYPSNTINFADDPDNSVGNDDAYILPITDSGLEFHPFIPYALNAGGTNFGFSSYLPPNYQNFSSWDVLSLESSDAVQTRSPNGTYFHGISYGEMPIMGGEDGLLIVPQASNDYILYLNGNNYRDVNHFDFSQDLNFLSPGLPNSSNNQTYINFLKVYGCDSNGGHGKWENQSLTWLKAYPNPTNSSMTIEYYLPNDVADVQLKIYDITARLIWDAPKSNSITKNKQQVEIGEDILKSGVYFCELSYLNEKGTLERDVLKLVKTK